VWHVETEYVSSAEIYLDSKVPQAKREINTHLALNISRIAGMRTFLSSMSSYTALVQCLLWKKESIELGLGKSGTPSQQM